MRLDTAVEVIEPIGAAELLIQLFQAGTVRIFAGEFLATENPVVIPAADARLPDGFSAGLPAYDIAVELLKIHNMSLPF